MESRRLPGGRAVQKTPLYLGGLNDPQHTGWCKTIVGTVGIVGTQLALFPSGRSSPPGLTSVQVRKHEWPLHRPRQWGVCWLAVVLWNQLKPDDFWGPLLPPSQEGTNGVNVLKTLTA